MRITRKVTAALAVPAVALGLSLAACSGGSGGGGGNVEYASGYAFGQAAASGYATTESIPMSTDINAGDSVINACGNMYGMGASGMDQMGIAGEPVPANEAPPQNVNGTVAQQWVNGCVAGYNS